jgi:hypothetical protein
MNPPVAANYNVGSTMLKKLSFQQISTCHYDESSEGRLRSETPTNQQDRLDASRDIGMTKMGYCKGKGDCQVLAVVLT